MTTRGAPGLEFRFSLAGVQLKFSMVRQDEKVALPAHGERGDWIVKVGAEEYPGLAENEFSMLQWAKAAGFDVPDSELRNAHDIPQITTYAPAGSRVLAIRRYDRADTQRIHQEDFMQVFGRAPRGEQKYESTYEELSAVADALLGEAGYEEVIRRLALILGQGNNDAHLKNWSLLYEEPGAPRLAPVYDQVATVAWTRLDRGLALKLAGTREFSRVNAESFGRLARKVGRDPERTMELARATLVDLQRTWEPIVRATPLPPDHSVALVEHWNRVPLLRDVGGLSRNSP